jgi:hypothetical protein
MRLFVVGVLLASACAASQPRPTRAPEAGALPFVDDDYARALGEARASRRPLFVEAWAPW